MYQIQHFPYTLQTNSLFLIFQKTSSMDNKPNIIIYKTADGKAAVLFYAPKAAIFG